MLGIAVETKSVDLFLDAFPRETAKAIRSAAVRSSRAMGTQANRTVARDMGIKVGEARKRITPFGPRTSDLTWGVKGDTKRIPLIQFGARGPEPSRGKGRGVTYRKGRGRGRGRVEHGFITTVGAGHRGVFQRKTRARLPIRELFGPSVGRVLSERQDEVKARGTEVFEKELDRLLDRILGRFGGSVAPDAGLPSFGGRLAA